MTDNATTGDNMTRTDALNALNATDLATIGDAFVATEAGKHFGDRCTQTVIGRDATIYAEFPAGEDEDGNVTPSRRIVIEKGTSVDLGREYRTCGLRDVQAVSVRNMLILDALN